MRRESSSAILTQCYFCTVSDAKQMARLLLTDTEIDITVERARKACAKRRKEGDNNYPANPQEAVPWDQLPSPTWNSSNPDDRPKFRRFWGLLVEGLKDSVVKYDCWEAVHEIYQERINHQFNFFRRLGMQSKNT